MALVAPRTVDTADATFSGATATAGAGLHTMDSPHSKFHATCPSTKADSCLFSKISIAEDASEGYFDAADTDHDGKLTFEEWAALDANKGTDKEKLTQQWAKFDSAGAGFLTKTQAILRLA
ncbi:hypothetical protein BD779DRAFT_1674142 [Infundibulicybe gibba]|nr:hypothetical protein BD779DRAFT_1674142 [Infundibulicybe gibba]